MSIERQINGRNIQSVGEVIKFGKDVVAFGGEVNLQ